MPGLELGGKDIIWVVRVALQPVCKCKRVMVSKGFRTGYNKTGYSVSHNVRQAGNLQQHNIYYC